MGCCRPGWNGKPGPRESSTTITAVERLLIAGRAAWFYAGKLFWPENLVFIYPRWQISQGVWWQYLFPLAAVGLLLGLWLLRRRVRGPLAAVLFFGGTLFPALGFLNVYTFESCRGRPLPSTGLAPGHLPALFREPSGPCSKA